MGVVFSQHIHTLLQYGLDLLFPPRCAGCQHSGSLLCFACRQTMQPLAPPLCRRCGTPLPPASADCPACRHHRPALHGLRYVHAYQGPLRQAIHALKYGGQRRLAEPLGALLAEAFRSYQMRTDGLIPLPLHVQRQQQRGYNQSVLLARVCAARLNVPCLEDLVVRQRATQPQVGLVLHERRQNVAGAFVLTPDARSRLASCRSLLLIDDVYTTGSTLEACAAPLYAAGLQQIWSLVLARPAGLAQDASKGVL